MKHKEYGRIDSFRILAALLVIAAHYPVFLSFNTTLDYTYTRIIARIAVPFFFVSSAFFLFNNNLKSTQTKDKVFAFMKRNLKYYILCIIIYLPFNFIGGSYKQWSDIHLLLQQFLWNGTFYHLWFFMGSLVGAYVAWLLLKTFNLKSSIFFAGVLYVIGLFGDSYYGFIFQTPIISTFYDGIFFVFESTRNGIFMAPIFFVLGAYIARKIQRNKLVFHMSDLIISSIALLLEGIILYQFHIVRSDIHNTMYISLIPFTYSLFTFFVAKEKPRNVVWRNTSLYMYILHPMIIIVMQKILLGILGNTMVFYIILCALSFGISYGLARIEKFNQLINKITA